MLLTFFLKFMQIAVQLSEPMFPDMPIICDPAGRGLQWLCLQSARTPLRLPTTHDQPGALQHVEMLGYPGKSHIERLGEFRDRDFARHQACEDCTPRGVSQRGEGDAQLIWQHLYLTDTLIN